MRIYLVRHADAGDRNHFQGPDRLRPLSERGWRQAAGLAKNMERFDVSLVLSSPYLRCTQTVEGLAAERSLAVVPEDTLQEGSSWRAALRLIESARVPTVMCSQGDVIGGLVLHLVARGLVDKRAGKWQKASTWVLEVEAGAVTSASYLPPPDA